MERQATRARLRDARAFLQLQGQPPVSFGSLLRPRLTRLASAWLVVVGSYLLAPMLPQLPGDLTVLVAHLAMATSVVLLAPTAVVLASARSLDLLTCAAILWLVAFVLEGEATTFASPIRLLSAACFGALLVHLAERSYWALALAWVVSGLQLLDATRTGGVVERSATDGAAALGFMLVQHPSVGAPRVGADFYLDVACMFLLACSAGLWGWRRHGFAIAVFTGFALAAGFEFAGRPELAKALLPITALLTTMHLRMLWLELTAD